MVVNKRTNKNQPTPPEAVVEALADDDVACDNDRIVITSLHPGGASAVRANLFELGMSEADVADAVNWARQA